MVKIGTVEAWYQTQCEYNYPDREYDTFDLCFSNLLQWGIQRGIIVIPKTINPQRLKENFHATAYSFSSEQAEQINQMDRHFRYVDGTFWTDDNTVYTLESLWDE